jgi:hypothetical protein
MKSEELMIELPFVKPRFGLFLMAAKSSSLPGSIALQWLFLGAPEPRAIATDETSEHLHLESELGARVCCAHDWPTLGRQFHYLYCLVGW